MDYDWAEQEGWQRLNDHDDDVEFPLRGSFNRDPLFYHVNLFQTFERWSVVHQTEKAILFDVIGYRNFNEYNLNNPEYARHQGQFWVPKALLYFPEIPPMVPKVHNSFRRKYIKQNQ